jgi:hypothetical protein
MSIDLLVAVSVLCRVLHPLLLDPLQVVKSTQQRPRDVFHRFPLAHRKILHNKGRASGRIPGMLTSDRFPPQRRRDFTAHNASAAPSTSRIVTRASMPSPLKGLGMAGALRAPVLKPGATRQRPQGALPPRLPHALPCVPSRTGLHHRRMTSGLTSPGRIANLHTYGSCIQTSHRLPGAGASSSPPKEGGSHGSNHVGSDQGSHSRGLGGGGGRPCRDPGPRERARDPFRGSRPGPETAWENIESSSSHLLPKRSTTSL